MAKYAYQVRQAATIEASPSHLPKPQPFGSRLMEEAVPAKTAGLQNSFANVTIQPKFMINAPGDTYEREANQVAHQVTQRLVSPARVQSPTAGPTVPIVQRASGYSIGAAPTEVEKGIQQAQGTGQMLPKDVRAPMEQAFGHSFARVRVHADRHADRLNQLIQARAFTTGSDIFFRRGEYAPADFAGKELLAHELTHVVQQNSGKPGNGALIQRAIGFEYETSMATGWVDGAPLTPDEETGATPFPRLANVQNDPGGWGDNQRLNRQGPPHGPGGWVEALIRNHPKGFELLTGPDYKVTAEEGSALAYGSTLEMVITEVPEDNNGRNRLIRALNSIANIFDAIMAQPYTSAGSLAAASGNPGRVELNTFVARVGNPIGDPQVTAGISLDRLPRLMQHIGVQPDVNVLAMPDEQRDLGSQRGDDWLALGHAPAGAQLAVQAYIDDYRRSHGANPPLTALYEELIAIVALIGMYLKAGERLQEYPKGIASIMARSNFAYLFHQLHPNVRAHFNNNNQAEWLRLGQSILISFGVANGLDHPMLNLNRLGYNVLTRRMWLQDLPQGRDLLTKYLWPIANERAALMSMGALADPASGHPGGTALAHPGEPVGLPILPGGARRMAPIFELRRMKKGVPYNQFMDIALGAFDYIVALNESRADARYTRHVKSANEQARGRLEAR